MKPSRKVAAAAAAAVTAGALALGASALPASANSSRTTLPDVACVRAGLNVLATAPAPQGSGFPNLLTYAAVNGVPLSVIGGQGSLPLQTVLELHLDRSQNQIFPWCRR